MNNEVPFFFEVIVRLMEFLVVMGVISSIYFVKKTKRKRRERRNPR